MGGQREFGGLAKDFLAGRKRGIGAEAAEAIARIGREHNVANG